MCGQCFLFVFDFLLFLWWWGGGCEEEGGEREGGTACPEDSM